MAEVEGLDCDLTRLELEELVTMREFYLEQHRYTTELLGVIQAEILRQTHEPLPFDDSGITNYEHMLGRAVLAEEIDAAEAYEAIGRFEQ